MHRSEVHRLDPTRQYWVPAVVAPERDWEGSPGCTRGARFMVEIPVYVEPDEPKPSLDTVLDPLVVRP